MLYFSQSTAPIDYCQWQVRAAVLFVIIIIVIFLHPSDVPPTCMNSIKNGIFVKLSSGGLL